MHWMNAFILLKFMGARYKHFAQKVKKNGTKGQPRRRIGIGGTKLCTERGSSGLLLVRCPA